MLIVLVAVSLTPLIALGDEFVVTPSLAVKAEYNDNIFLSPDTIETESDYITTVMPGLSLGKRNERMDLLLAAHLSWLTYRDKSELDDVDHDWRSSLGVKVAERTHMHAQASYLRDSRPDRDVEMSEVVYGNDPLRRFNCGLTLMQDMSEEARATVGYVYNQDLFAGNEDYDSTWHNVSLGLTAPVSRSLPNTKGRAGAQGLFYDAKDMRVLNASLTLGVQQDISEALTFAVDAGPRFTTTEFQVFPPDHPEGRTNHETGVTGSASLTYRSEAARYDITLYQRLVSLSGTQGVPERRSVRVALNRRFSHEVRADLSAAYNLSTSDRGDYSLDEIDEQLWWAQPRLTYEFTPEWSLAASYRFTKVRDLVPDESKEQNRFILQITWAQPFRDLMF